MCIGGNIRQHQHISFQTNIYFGLNGLTVVLCPCWSKQPKHQSLSEYNYIELDDMSLLICPWSCVTCKVCLVGDCSSALYPRRPRSTSWLCPHVPRCSNSQHLYRRLTSFYLNQFREGFKKKWFLSLWGLTPPLESDKNIFYFFILDHFLSTFWKKFFLPLEKLKTLRKNFKIC